MKKRIAQRVLYTAAGIALFSLAPQAHGQIIVDGTLDKAYGSPLAVQTINTGFGDSTIGDGTSNGGSELDAAYGNVSGGNLYLFFAGNFENNGNHLNIFIADGRSGGQNILAANSSSGNLSAANGLTFPTNFNATYAIDANDYSNTMYIDQYDLTKNSANYIGSVPLTGGIGNSQNLNGIAIGVNDTNAAGVNGSSGTAADPNAASSVMTGFELAIPLAALGNPTGSVQVLAAINGGGDTYLSNQFLPGLPVGSGDLGSPASVNLGAAGVNSSSFSVAVPAAVANGNWLPAVGGSWNSSANWSNGIIPNANGASATFATASQASTVSLDSHITVGSITFSSANSYTITPGTGGILTLNNNGSSALVTTYSGSHTISAPMVLASSAVFSAISHGDSLYLSGNISGSGSLTAFDQGGSAGGQFPPSNIVLSGSNTYTGGTIVSGGNLQLGSATALPVGTALSLNAVDLPSGVLDLNGFPATVSSLVVTTGSNTANLGANGQIINTSITPGVTTLTYAGNSSSPSVFTGSISDSNASGGGTTALAVTSGSLTLTNTNTYAGSTTVTGAKLTLGTLLYNFNINTYYGASTLPAGTNLNIGSGASVVASTVLNNSAPAEYAVTVGSLSVLGKLDLNNNALVVHNSSVGAVTALLASGYNGGKWNGTTGIVSSTAAADSTHLTALGVILNNTDGSTPLFGSSSNLGLFDGTSPLATDVLVKYTYYGDTNLDGVVDGTDYSRIDNAFTNNQNSSNPKLTGWFNGDFNYDGIINGSDYALIDNAFNQQGASLASAVATAQIGGTSVPEPACFGAIAVAAALLGRRRSNRWK